MSYAILIVLVLALLHFIYDGIVLPSIRLNLRNKLFKLRDDLRNHRIENPDIDDNAFRLMDDGINSVLSRLSQFTISLQMEMEKELKESPELQEYIDQRISIIRNSDDIVLKAIHKKTNIVLEHAFIANTGAWFFYLLPIVLVVLFFKGIRI